MASTLGEKLEEKRRLDAWIAGYEQCLKDHKLEEKPPIIDLRPPPYSPPPSGIYPYSPTPFKPMPLPPISDNPWYRPRRCPRCRKVHHPDCGCPGHYRIMR